jgi:chemotaxis protein MotA
MPTTMFGIIFGLGLMAYSIYETSQNAAHMAGGAATLTITQLYLNPSAFLLVFGGTVSSTLIAHQMSHIIRAIKAFVTVFTKREINFIKIIEDICEFSVLYTQQGATGLDQKLKTYKIPNMIKDGIAMIVNGYKPEEIKRSLEINLHRRYDREMLDFLVFRTMGRTAPAFGMVGTVVGMIFMLSEMKGDPSKIGPFLSVALVATFYGLVLAWIFFNPMGNKLQGQAELNLRIGRMEIDGIMYVLEKQHPVYIKDQLSYFIPPALRARLFKESK